MIRTSKYTNLSQTAIKWVVFFVPSRAVYSNPYSRMRAARSVKLLSLGIRQKLEKRLVYSKFMASIIITLRLQYYDCEHGT
jgi:hypothetical protein